MAVKYTQDNRPMAVSTVLAKDALLLERVHGTEAISELFEFRLHLLTQPEAGVRFDSLMGQRATVRFAPRGDQTPRFVNGILCRFGQEGVVRGPNGDRTFVRYTATLVPDLWRLTKTFRSRIFQQITVPDILKEVFKGYDVEYRLTGKYDQRDYCSQYKESDYQFACRIMEEEGIFFYFKHADGSHKLVVGDGPAAHDPIPGEAGLIFDDVGGSGQNNPEDRIRGWSKTQELTSGKVMLRDHTFELPKDNLITEMKVKGSVQVGSVVHQLAVGGNDQFEIFDYPGRYAQRRDGVDPSGGDRPGDIPIVFDDHNRTAGLRMEQEATGAVAVEARGTVRTVTAGHKFRLTRHGEGDGEYVVRRVEITGDLRDVYHNRESDGTEEFGNTFSVLPAGLPFRPPFTGERGRVHGVQAGTVVGPAGEEIFTDKYGRVKVQFRWHREGEMNASSSCWVRVGTMWAGAQWGMIHIPRIGQEVLIAFEEGDPDRPIVVGSVFNADQMPPYKLPANRTQSGIKSRSSLKGTADNFNELRFEDKKGQEQVYLHAEKNFDQVVENNQTLKVGFREGNQTPEDGNQTVEIFNNQGTTIGKPHPDGTDPFDGSQTHAVWNNQVLSVGAGEGKAADGSQTETIWNSQTLVVGKGEGQAQEGSQKTTIYKDQTTKLKTGNRTVVVEMGNDALTISKGNRTTKIKLGKDSTDAMQSITLKVGANKIVIDQTGITIDGIQVKINGKKTDVTGMLVSVKANGPLTVGGLPVSIG